MSLLLWKLGYPAFPWSQYHWCTFSIRWIPALGTGGVLSVSWQISISICVGKYYKCTWSVLLNILCPVHTYYLSLSEVFFALTFIINGQHWTVMGPSEESCSYQSPTPPLCRISARLWLMSGILYHSSDSAAHIQYEEAVWGCCGVWLLYPLLML